MSTATQVDCKLNPTEDRVIVRKMESEEKTSGGILLPDSAKEKPQFGIVLKVGPGKKNDKGEQSAVTLQVGQKVVYAKYSGTEIKLDGVEYLILRESDILATLS